MLNSEQVLPTYVPQGDQWVACIANRTFKSMVIEYVILTLPAMLLKNKPNRKLIIDYKEPELYTWKADEVERSEISGAFWMHAAQRSKRALQVCMPWARRT